MSERSMNKGESTPPEIANGLNRRALNQIKAKMLADPKLGSQAKVCVKAIWEKGIARSADGKLISHPPAEVALGKPQYPNMNDYCPLVSSACYSTIYMMEAAKKNVQFDYFETNMCTDADFSCLYQERKAMTNPWRHGVTLDVRITGPFSQDEMDKLGAAAQEHCPVVEVLEREFPVTSIVTGKQVEVENKRQYYDMEKYRALANSSEPVIVKQNVNGFWYCHNDSKSFPGALMKLEFGFGLSQGTERQIPLSFDKPIASGKYASPVQLCFFGGLSTHMHSIALLLYAKGYKIERITGSASALMNKRAVMGFDSDNSYIFSNGITLEIEVETDAPPEVVDEVRYEAEGRCPVMMNWGNAIPLETRILKETGRSDSNRGLNVDDDLLSISSDVSFKPKSRWNGFGKMFKKLRYQGSRLSFTKARTPYMREA